MMKLTEIMEKVAPYQTFTNDEDDVFYFDKNGLLFFIDEYETTISQVKVDKDILEDETFVLIGEEYDD